MLVKRGLIVKIKKRGLIEVYMKTGGTLSPTISVPPRGEISPKYVMDFSLNILHVVKRNFFKSTKLSSIGLSVH